MGISLLRGRAFNPSDNANGQFVVDREPQAGATLLAGHQPDR